jgi:hypothetical protein
MHNQVVSELFDATKARCVIEQLSDRIINTPEALRPFVSFFPFAVLFTSSVTITDFARAILMLVVILLLWTIHIVVAIWIIVYLALGGSRDQLSKNFR